MKRKLRLVSSIFSLALAFTFMAIGVFAAATRTVTISGTLSFESTTLGAEITTKYTNVQPAAPSTSSTTEYTNTGGTATFLRGDSDATKAISGINFAFTETNSFAGILVSIKNTDTTNLTLTAPANGSAGSVDYTVTTSGTTITPDATVTVYIVFSVKDPTEISNFAGQSYNLSFVLNKA